LSGDGTFWDLPETAGELELTVSNFNGPRGRPFRVLHVDDDPMNLRVVEEILSAFGHHAVKAASGREALEHLGRQAFDVVLMDIHMPEMSGIEVVRRLRASIGPERNTPVIALTADVLSHSMAEYLAMGFNDFVAKPIMVSVLRDAVQRASAPAPERVSHAG
jgi:CheY-like chemotaxis protein